MTAADQVAVLRAAAGYLHEFGMNRTPTADAEPSLGRIICTAHTIAGVRHNTDGCSQLQTAVARYGDCHTLDALVAHNTTRAIVEHLREFADRVDVAGEVLVR